MNVRSLCAPWVALHESLGLGGPVRDKQHYGQLLEVAEWLMDEIARDAASPFAGLAELVADRLREYESRVHPWGEGATPASVLAFLMQQHGLRQGDLPEVAPQSVISEVLAGKRELNLRQVQALAARFGVPMEVFVG